MGVATDCKAGFSLTDDEMPLCLLGFLVTSFTGSLVASFEMVAVTLAALTRDDLDFNCLICDGDLT